MSSDGEFGKYARPECERRFLLSAVPAGATSPVAITDRYVQGTRLRLRSMDADGQAPVFKFGQKLRPRPEDPSVVMITNIYLSASEYELLAQLPAEVIEKTRWAAPLEDSLLAIDEFHGRAGGGQLRRRGRHAGFRAAAVLFGRGDRRRPLHGRNSGS